jgi:hypothetical protein
MAAMSDTAGNKEQELRYVAEVFARHAKTNPGKEVKVKRGPWGIFGTTTRNDTYNQVGGSFSQNESGVLDLSTVQEALAKAGELTAQAKKRLEGWRDNPPKPGIIYESSLETELWIGTAEQFEVRPFEKVKLWSRRGELGAAKLADDEITQAALEAFIARHDTHDIRQKKKQDEMHAAIAAAVAPAEGVKPMQPLKLKSPAA